MALCPSCGTDNPERAKFCLECATPLEAEGAVAAEERKVVSVLFVDLVGFTERSHDADPEDVRAILAPYHARLKREIERYGGTVEKFIGDAVVAAFGAPVAREDDAERAVRAGLRAAEAIEQLNEDHDWFELAIRAAVNTGEGLVNLKARPQAGEALITGDVVNTASRLQATAPVGEVVVGEITYRATRHVISYEELEPVRVKGKPQPIPVWRAVSARSRLGVDVTMTPATPFVGRNSELDLLTGTFQRTVRERSVQLVTIAGEPGVGKSRLVSELSRFVDDQPDLVYWRQGRSLPYGEGITFWALGEIVKAQAGILESDSSEEAGNKLEAAIAALTEAASERSWLRSRLAPLIGLEVLETSQAAPKEESFTAWRRFLEAIAERSSLVVVFEDLHWADQALLEFIDHVVDWSSSGVALMIVCTARPELYESTPEWGAGKENSTTIPLSPLTDSETAQLISGLLSQAVLPASVHFTLLERAGGNPLYAEEFVRMLSDRGILERTGRVVSIAEDADFSMPETVQALIAARLDTLAPERKALLHDASVVGKVFWSGAVASLGGLEEREVHRGLHDLSRKEFVRPARASSINGEQEYSFWHALVRDVSYSQIPRATRLRRHKSVAVWLQELVGDRVRDRAELFVHHYTKALDLARAVRDKDEERALIEPTRRFLILAGNRALDLDMTKAVTYFEGALRLFSATDSIRPGLMNKLGRAAVLTGHHDAAERYLKNALAEARGHEDLRAQGMAVVGLAIMAWHRGDSLLQRKLMLEAVQLLEREDPGPELAETYAHAAVWADIGGRTAEAIEYSEKALSLARQIGDQTVMVVALTARGGARCSLGDLAGIDDLQRAIQEGQRLGLGTETGTAYNWLAEESWLLQGTKQAASIYGKAIEFAERRGAAWQAADNRSEFLRVLFDVGEWDRITGLAHELLEWSKTRANRQVEAKTLVVLTQVLFWRGRYEEVDWAHLLGLARKIEDPQVLVPALAVSALVAEKRGDVNHAAELIRELDSCSQQIGPWRAHHLPTAIRILVREGHEARAAEFCDTTSVAALRDRNCLLTGRAVLVEGQQDHQRAVAMYDDAAERWAEFGFALEHGQALLGAARCSLALGRHDGVRPRLSEAREIFSKLGARPLIDEVDAHLETATALAT
jgi:class 3 adenylate cyclase